MLELGTGVELLVFDGFVLLELFRSSSHSSMCLNIKNGRISLLIYAWRQRVGGEAAVIIWQFIVSLSSLRRLNTP